MSNKIVMIYENKEYKVVVDGQEVEKNNDGNFAFEKFRVLVEENELNNEWNQITQELRTFNNDDVIIDDKHEAVAFKSLKYFYKTNKIFYANNGEMIQLTGGKYLLPSLLKMISNGEMSDVVDFIDFLKDIINSKATYRVTDGGIIVSSASFNYGSAEFTFSNGRINKGASIEKGTFEIYKEYVLSILK